MTHHSSRPLAVGLLAVAAITFLAAPVPVGAHPPVADDAAVITRWNEITQRTLTENAVPIPASGLYYGFVSLAMYDAVVTIKGRYEPWAEQPRARARASAEVAAATAAYDVLRHYFPASAEALASDYRAALRRIHNGVGKVHGIRVGRAAAAELISQRADDGRGAAVPQPGGEPFEAGEWRPTPPALAPMAVPWLGFVDPLLLPSPTSIPLGGPPALDSAQYASDFAEVRDFGGSTSSRRDDDQTATALFWSANAVSQYQTAMRDQVSDRGLDIVDSARAFAVFDASMADALVSCWRAKYDVNFWRPVTAIALADTDGNDATDVVEGWTPLFPTPPYSDYTSGHACATGAVTGTLENLFGTTLVPAFAVPSLASGTPDRQYTSTAALDVETMNARIWLGIHFRTAMTDGNALGHAVAEEAAAHHFQPVDCRRHHA